MFDNHHRRSLGGIKFRDGFKGGIGIIDIVVGELFALHLLGGGHTKTLFGHVIKGGLLVGVFTIAHGLGDMPTHGAIVRLGDLKLGGKPIGTRGIIARGAGIGFGRPSAARFNRRRALIGVEFRQQGRVI